MQYQIGVMAVLAATVHAAVVPVQKLHPAPSVSNVHGPMITPPPVWKVKRQNSTEPIAAAESDDPLCVPFQNPSQNEDGYCTCDSISLPFLTSTDNICGYTSVPSSQPPPTTSASPYTSTDYNNGEVYSCESSSYYNYAVNTIAECVGASEVISTVTSIAAEIPTATVQFGTPLAFVGTFSGEALRTQVVSAMQAKCTQTVCDPTCHCDSSSFDISGVEQTTDGGAHTPGTLSITVQQSAYRDTDELDMMVQSIGFGLNASATGDNCAEKSWINACGPGVGCVKGHETECNAAGIVNTQLVNAVDGIGGEVGQMSLQLQYNAGFGSQFTCGTILGAASLALGFVVPEAEIGAFVFAQASRAFGGASFVCSEPV